MSRMDVPPQPGRIHGQLVLPLDTLEQHHLQSLGDVPDGVDAVGVPGLVQDTVAVDIRDEAVAELERIPEARHVVARHDGGGDSDARPAPTPSRRGDTGRAAAAAPGPPAIGPPPPRPAAARPASGQRRSKPSSMRAQQERRGEGLRRKVLATRARDPQQLRAERPGHGERHPGHLRHIQPAQDGPHEGDRDATGDRRADIGPDGHADDREWHQQHRQQRREGREPAAVRCGAPAPPRGWHRPGAGDRPRTPGRWASASPCRPGWARR